MVAVFYQTFGVASAISTALTFWAWVSEGGGFKQHRVLVGISALCFLAASFYAWEEQYRKVGEEESKAAWHWQEGLRLEHELDAARHELATRPASAAVDLLRKDMQARLDVAAAQLRDAQKNLATLEARSAPRSLRADQQARLLAALNGWRQSMVVDFEYLANNTEVTGYREGFESVFAGLGWPLRRQVVTGLTSTPAPSGLAVAARPGAAPAHIFVSVLREMGVPFDELQGINWPPDAPVGLFVSIARRPD